MANWQSALSGLKQEPKKKNPYEENLKALRNTTDTSTWKVVGDGVFGANGEDSTSILAGLLDSAGKRDRDATYDFAAALKPRDSGMAAALEAYTRHVDYEREQEEAARLAEEQAKAARYGGGRTTTAQPAANPTAADEIRNKYSELIRRAQNDLYTAQGMNGENDMGAAEEAQRRITQYQNEMNAELEKLTLNNKEMVDAFNESIPERSREAARQRPKVEPNPPRQSSSNIAQLEWELSYAQGTGTQEDIEAAQRNLAQAYAKQAVGSDDAPDAAASELISAEDRARVAEYQRYEAVSTEELNAQIAQYQQDAADAEEAQSKYALEATTRNGKGANDKEYRDFLERKFNEAVAAEEEANAKIAEAQKLLREKQAYESNLTQEQMNQLRTQANLQSEFDEARAAVERAQEVYNQAVSDLETGAARNSRAANAEMQYYADMYEIRANQLNALVNQYERRQANGADEETLQILYNNIRQAQEDVNVLGTGYSAKTEAANAASAEAEKAAESVIGAQNALDIANGHLANTIGRYYEATAGQYSGTSDKYREAYEQVQGLDVLISGYERKLEYARNNEDPNVPYYMSDRAKYAARIDELKAERAKYEAFAWQYEASRTLESMTGTEIRDFNILAQEYAKLRENVKSQAISVALDESGMSNSVQNVSSTGVKLSENGERLRKYYVNKYGEEQFNRMLELAQREANRRRVESMAETVRNGKWYEDVGYSAFSVVSNVLSAPGVITEIVLQATDNSKAPIDTNAPGFAMQNATRTIRSEVGQKIEQSVLNAGGNETAAHWAGIGYSTLMSGIDSLVAMALGGALGASSGLEGEALQELSSKVGGAFLGVTATTNAAQESLERGESLETSVLKGIVAGVFEGLFEKYSIEKLGKLGEMEMKEGFKDVLRNMGKSALTNFSEEFNTELANLAYDGIQWLFTGDSELKDRYEEIKASYGLTDSQAAKSAAVELALALNLDENWAFAFDLLGQALEAGASGALMGAWFGAQYSIKPYAAYRNLNRVIDTIEDSPNARAYYEIQQRNFALDDDHRVDLPDYRQNVTTQEELRTMARQVQDAQIKQNADLKQWQAEHPEEAAAARQKAQELGAVNVHTVADMDEVNAQAEAGAAAGTADAQAQDAREGVRIDEESVSRETAGNTEQTTNTQPAGTQGEPVFNEFAEERARDELAALDRYADRPTYDERVQRRIAELRAEGSDDVADAMQQAVNARQSGAAEQTQTAEAAATAETSSMRTTVPAQTGYTALSGLDAQDRANVTADVQQVVRGATDRDGTINVEFANDIADNMENTYRASGREDLIVPFRNAVNEAINGGNENAVLYDNESGRGTGTSAAEQSGRVAGRAGEAESAAERSAESAGGQTGTAQSRAGETGESGQISDSAVSDMTEIAGEDGYSGHKVTNVTNAPEYDALNESADAFGVNLTIVKGQLWFNTESGRPFKTNGAFDPANNKIYVQADDPGVSANVIFLHELFHMMAVQNADMYDDVVAKVTELYGDDLENVLRDYRESYSDLGNVSDPYLMQELCADIYAGYDRKNHGQSRYTEQIQAVSDRFDTTTPERKNDIRFSATEPHDDLTNTVESGYQTDENAEVPTMEQKAASAAAGETLRERERKIYEQALAKRDRTLADNLHKQWAAEDKAKELYREANMERAAFRADGNADHLNRANALTKQGKAEWQKASRLSKQTNHPVGDLYEPKRAIRTAADGIMRAFNVKSGLRAQARYRITEILRDIYRSGKVDDADLYNVVTRLANDSISYVMPDAAYEEAYNGYLKGARIYVDPATRAEFGDAEGWRDFQKHCWAMRIYLTSNANDRAVDSYYDELSSAVSRSIFDEDVTDKAAQLQVMADAAEFGMPREVSLVEAMREEGVESDELYEQLFNDMLDLLTTFAEQANLETRLSITPDTDMMRTRAHYEARLERAEERNRAARDAQAQKARERIADIRESERQKRDDLRQRLTQEGRDMRDEAVARERQKRDEMLEKFKKHVQDVNQGAKERRQRSETINRIRKELDRIYKRAKVNEADYTRVISQQDELTREDMEDAYSELNGIATSMVGYEITNPAQLAAWLKDYKRVNTDFDASDLLDGAVNLLVEIKDWQKMSVENLNLLLDVLQRIDYALNTAHKMIGGAWNERANEVGEQMRKETRSAKGSRIAGSNASSARARAAYLFNEDSLSYSRNLKRYGDWNPNSVMYKFAEAFERGDMDYMNYKLGADMVLMPFLARRSNAANREWLYTAAGKDAKLTELTLPASQVVGDGDAPASDTVKVKLNQMQLVQMMLDLRNEDNVYHVEHGGYTFPDAEMYNEKGRKADAYKEGGHITVRMTRAQMQNAVDTYLAKEGKAFAELLDKYYNVYAKPHINATSRALEGVDKALNLHYYPIRTDSNYRGKTYQPYTSVIENMGPLKERIVGANNPIYLCDADETYQWHKELMGKYVGYAIPMRDFQTVMKYQPHHDTVSNRGVLEEKFSGNAGRFIDSFEKFINSSQFEDASTLSNLLGNYVSNILNANISSMLKQFAALPLAGSTYGMEPINYAIAHLGRKVDLDLIRKYTAYLDERSDGITYDQVTDIVREKAGSAGRIALATALGRNWLSATDYWANKLMWIAAEHYVDTHTSLRPGSEADIQAGKDPYYQKVAEVFDRMTFDTQTNSNTMAKPNILRHVSGDVKALTLFKTDAFQMQGILREAFGQNRWAQENGTDSEKYEAKQKTYHAVQGVVLSSVTQAALAAIAMVLRRKDDKLKDDEGNYDWKKIGKSLGADAFENVAGAVLFGEEIVSAIWSMFDKDQQWYGVEAPALEAISDFANTLYNQLPKLFSTIFTAADGAGAQWLSNNSDKITNPIMRIARDTARIFGIPFANIEKNLLGALGWIWPEVAVGMSDLYTAYSKSSLTGKKGRELEASIRAYLTDEVGRFSDEAMKEYARLYGEFGNDALPGFGEPTVYDEEGEKRDLTPEEVGRWDSAYRTTMLDLANEIVESDVYKALTDDEKLSLLESAEAYAKDAAKAAIGLDAGKLVQTVDAAVGDNIDTATALMCYGAMKSQGKYADKFLALDALPIPDEQKAAYFHINYPSTAKAWAEAAETMTDLEFLAFAREKYGTADAEAEAPGTVTETPAAPMPQAETENAQEAAETPQEPPIDPAKEAAYQNAVEAGMSESGARAAVDAASTVKSDNARDRQAAAAAAVEDAEDQLAAVRLYADYPEADYARYSAANGYGVSPSAFLTWYNDATAKDPNHSLSQNEAQAALDAMDDLTQEQKAAMWQLCNAQWSAKKNPYAVYIGEQVREAYYANRGTTRSMPMPEIADGPYTSGNRPTARQADNVTGRGSVYRRGHEHESGQSLEDPYNGYHYDGSVVYDDNGNTYDFSSVHTELQSLDGTTNLTERQNTEYENLKASGMDYDSALSVVRRLYDDFFPEGPDDLRYKQMNAVMAIEDEHRFWSAWEMDTLEDKKYKEANELAAIRYYSDQPDADYARFSAALNVGTRPSDYMEMFRDFEELYGTAKPSQTQVEGYIENYIGPLMGDRQKAALWQLANPNWSAKDNPYSVMVGEQIQDAYYANLNLGR